MTVPKEGFVPSTDTTELLDRWGSGDAQAGELVLERLYPNLRNVARGHIRRSDLSLGASDLLQEVCLRLVVQQDNRWQNRAHFFALVARTMRRVLADGVKSRHRQKRRGSRIRTTLEETQLAVPEDSLDHLVLDQALDRLAEIDPIAARTVELRYFIGLNFDETAAALEISRATAVRRWRYARAWLYLELRGEDGA